MRDADTIDRIIEILALPDGHPDLGGEFNEWADVVRCDLIREVINRDGPADGDTPVP